MTAPPTFQQWRRECLTQSHALHRQTGQVAEWQREGCPLANLLKRMTTSERTGG